MILQPPATLVAGPTGTGKTFSIATQLQAGLETFVIITEPGGVESLLIACEKLGITDVSKLHWTSALPGAADWASLEDMISKINSMDQKGLSDEKNMGKDKFRPAAMKFLNAFKNFHCERTNQDFGDFSTWNDTRSMNVDSLTGWSVIAWGATVGYKPTANPGEWGIAQNFIYNFLMKIMNDRKCFFNLTAHIEKEMDENVGVKKFMVSTIGAKLAPKIPPFFSEFVRTYKDLDSKATDPNNKAKFRWSTLTSDMDLKNRSLPISDNLPASFVQIVDAYKRRKKLATGPVAAVASIPATATS